MATVVHRRDLERQMPNRHKAGSRTLATYPMNHDFRDTLQIVSECKNNTQRKRVDVKKAGAVSDSLARRSKTLFEDAVENASRVGSARMSSSSLPRLSPADTNTPSYAPRCISRPVTSSGHSKTSFAHGGMTSSGPTLHGSPIHNYRTKLLNEIRMQTKCGAFQSPEDSIPTPSPDIKNILMRSNSAFRVIPVASGLESASHQWEFFNNNSFPHYRLVPKNVDAENEEERPDFLVNNRSSGTTPEKIPIFINSLSSDDVDFGSPRDDVHPAEDSSESEDTGLFLGPCPEVCPIAKSSGLCVDRPQKSTSSVPSAGSSKSHTRSRRVTWVDDATVSSVVCAHNQNDVSSLVDVNACAKDNDKDTLKPAEEEQAEIAKVVNLNDLKEQAWSLPDFICPTSEEKSKEARMRHWLQDNNFEWANKSVPLL